MKSFETWFCSGWEGFGEAQRGKRESQALRLACGKMEKLHGEGKNQERKPRRAAVARRGHLQSFAPTAEANDTSQAFRHNWRRKGCIVFCIPCWMKGFPPRPESQRNIASLGMNPVSDFVRQNETGTHHPRQLGVAKRAVQGDDRSFQYLNKLTPFDPGETRCGSNGLL